MMSFEIIIDVSAFFANANNFLSLCCLQTERLN